MRRLLRAATVATVAVVGLSGCGFSPYDLPLPGGADLGDNPYTVRVQFRDVLDLVPQSAVRVNDVAVGKVTDIELKGWTAMVTLELNRDAKLPDNAEATIRQTSLLGEKFVSLAPPATGATGTLSDGDMIPLDRSGRNPEIEEVLGAASLLFNGGGLEKTNTIIKELNHALGGHESQVKELIGTTSTFISQLDDNKQALLTSLEKVNRLATRTNQQKDAITGALDELPAALTVINQQRDDLVKLMESLAKLGDVATGVIHDSKADTVADLKALGPILRNLVKAGDDVAYSARALLTFPFTDGVVGNTVAKASGTCNNENRENNTGVCFGDYANLSIRLDVSAAQLENLLGGFDLGDLSGADTGGPTASTSPAPTDDSADFGPEDLTQLVAGLVEQATTLPELELPGSTSTTAPTEPVPSATSGQKSALCSLLKLGCRPAPAGVPAADLGRILLEPVVAP